VYSTLRTKLQHNAPAINRWIENKSKKKS